MKVVSVGNIYLDINISSLKNTEETLSPEKEYLSDIYKTALGGSAVISPLVMAKLGIQPTFIGVVGQDEFGKIVKEKIQLSGIDPKLTFLDNVRTNIGVNASDMANRTFMYAAGSANQLLSPKIVSDTLDQLILENDMLYIGGAFKLPQLFEVFIEYAEKFQKLGKKIFLDHGRMPANLSVNEREIFLNKLLQSTTYYAPSLEDIPFEFDRKNINKLGKYLYSKFPKLTTHLKMGPDGSIIFSDNHITEIPTYKRINTGGDGNPVFVGAGDTSNAGFIYGISRGLTNTQAAELANKISYMHILSKPISVESVS